MAWLLAFVFAFIAGVLAMFLFLHWEDRKRAIGKLQALKDRLQTLETAEAGRAKLQMERDAIAKTYLTLRKRVAGLANADEEKDRVLAEARAYVEKFNRKQEQMEKEQGDLEKSLTVMRTELRQLSEDTSVLEMGFYKSRYSYSTSAAFQKALDANVAHQKEMLATQRAATVSDDNPTAASACRLLLRAFNGECDAAISKVRYNNIAAMENRIRKAFDQINKLGAPQACQISVEFLDLKVQELQLTHEHALKVQAEKEQQREIKEQMRQEAIAARELEKATQDAEAEERRRRLALERARRELEQAAKEHLSESLLAELQAKAAELERQLAEAHANKERAISRAQQTKSGHVYVISNIGSFGDNVFKIGMTRRLDPMDRVWELSDASVPFDFDVHAIIYTEDAPALESEFHRRFSDRRLNMVNQRKEFFHASIDEITEVVRERCGDIELTLIAEAAEFFQSESQRRENGMPLLSQRQMVLGGVR
jgi:hypothetical protein